jgi:ATP phosphoribosyltransferase regulatory subunit HisZ
MYVYSNKLIPLCNKAGAQPGKGRKVKMRITHIEIYKALESKLGKEDAEKLLTYIGEQTESAMEDVKGDVLTQKDKIDIITRMDAHFK